jgi:signal peptidase II
MCLGLGTHYVAYPFFSLLFSPTELHRVAVLWITFLIVLLDQISKMLIKGAPWAFLGWKGRPYGSSQKIIDDLVRFTYIENPGIAFGINIPAAKVFFSLFSVFASLGILWYMKRNVTKLSIWERVALALILGGAVGNLIDRVFYGVLYGEQALFYGRVVDFIDFGYKANWWPVFNVADSAVTCGVTLLIAIMLFKKPVAQNVTFATTPDLAHDSLTGTTIAGSSNNAETV